MEFFIGATKSVTQNPLAERVIRLGGVAAELFSLGRDRAEGRIGPGREPVFIDKKAIDFALEKAFGKSPAAGAILDVLFDGDKANKRGELPFGMNPDGTPRQVTGTLGAQDTLPPVVMLPMWDADP